MFKFLQTHTYMSNTAVHETSVHLNKTSEVL